MSTDRAAIEAVCNGDRERYAELVERHKKMVYGIAWSRLGDASLCEDAAQETFIKAFRYLTSLRNPDKFPGWLARIARNASSSLLQKHKRDLENHRRWQLEQRPPQTAAGEEETFDETLSHTLAEMPERQRECLVLFYMEEKSIAEAAAVLNISESAMKTRLHRARTALRGRLEQKIESGLNSLTPGKNFSVGVMVLLPKQPLFAASLGTASVGAKIFGGLFKCISPLSFISAFLVIPIALNGVLFSWFLWLETSNLAPGPLKVIRAKTARTNTISMALVGFIAVAISLVLMTCFGPLNLFRGLALLTAFGLWDSIRVLKVNRTPYALGVLLRQRK